MDIKRITAIVPSEILDALEGHLRASGAHGMTVEHVRGYGEHPNYFRRDLMRDNARVVVYAAEEKVDHIIAAVVRCAREVDTPAGILAVERIDRLVNLNDGADILADSL